MAKLPSNSFDYYIQLGVGRSYEAVARNYNCSKKAVTKKAIKEDWQRRLQRIEAKARQDSDQKAVETLDQMGDRHQKMLKLVQAKSIEALRNHPLKSAEAACRLLSLAIQGERAIRRADDEKRDPDRLTLFDLLADPEFQRDIAALNSRRIIDAPSHPSGSGT